MITTNPIIDGMLVYASVAFGSPSGPSLDVQPYVTDICGVTQIAFADDNTLFVGNGGSGCGVGPGDPAWVRRVPPGGGTFSNFGPAPIIDPDAVEVDGTGAITGTPGSVLVGYFIDFQGHLVAIAPDESNISTVFSGNAQLQNPTFMQFDNAGRLIIANANTQNGGIYELVGSTPALLIPPPADTFTTGTDGRIYVVDPAGGFDIYDAEGALLDSTFVEGLGPLSRAAFSSAGPFGEMLYATTPDGTLLRIDPQTGASTDIGQGFVGGDLEFGADGALYHVLLETIYRVTLSCPADLDASGDVGVNDLLALLAAWGKCAPPCAADLDNNGFVDVNDLLEMLADWGNCA